MSNAKFPLKVTGLQVSRKFLEYKKLNLQNPSRNFHPDAGLGSDPEGLDPDLKKIIK